MEVSVFNLRGGVLRKEARPGIRNPKESTQGVEREGNEIPLRLRQSRVPVYLEGRYTVQFWSPVFAGAAYSTEESLFLDANPPQRSSRVIGFIRVMVDKGVLYKQLDGLLFKSILIGIAFLLSLIHI